MDAIAADRDLLFGLLALQNGLIDQVQLVAAFQAWTRDKARPLADHLVARGDVDPDQRSGVAAMVGLHLKKHGSTEKSLAALSAGRSTRESLAALRDSVLERTLTHLGSGSDGDADRTASYSVGTATSDGQRFRILRPHAQGGLGAVFVALDAELQREVALKQILDDNADDPAIRQRFLLEAKVTGGLEHPGIVPVYGLGTYGDGRPYYAMRFVRGDSLKEAIVRFHADETLTNDPGRRSLELRQLLRRFTDVCHAIGYAHSRGVLHRDIKPGNVIVGRHGETLVVDWGLAKATGDSDLPSDERALWPGSGASSFETLPGSALGTPAYMSPEQAQGNLEALGARSDVYSLGATLYCMLTGQPPFVGEPGEVLRAVQQGEFRPPRAIDPVLDRALDAVCLKAMALRAEDRYGSCQALAEDVERWMADEPVSAWREPVGRRARRWTRRNRTAVIGAAIAVVAGLIGLAQLAVVQNRYNQELKVAFRETSRALEAETTAKNDATEALGQSENARQRAEAVLGFLKNDVLAAARPGGLEGGLGVAVTVRQAIDAAEPKIAGAFHDQPIVEADVRDTLGVTYYYLGEPRLSIRQHERALELRRNRLGTDHPETLKSCNNLAVAYADAGRAADAIAMHETTLKQREATLGADHRDTLNSRNSLAVAYEAAGRAADAIALYETTLKLRELKLGPEHSASLISRTNLAIAYSRAGRTAEAIALHEKTLKQREATLGPGHPDTLFSRNSLAVAYDDAGRAVAALAMYETTLKQQELTIGADHPDTLITRNNLADSYRIAGRYAEAIAMNEKTLKQRESKLGPDHTDTLITRNNLAENYRAAGRTAEAIAMHETTLKRLESTLGPDDPITLRVMNNLLGVYVIARRWPEAEKTARECLSRRENKQPDDWWCYQTRSQLGVALAGQNRYAEAEPLILSGYEGLKAREANIPAPAKGRVTEAAQRLVQLYEDLGKPEQAAAWRTRLGMAALPADVFARP